MLYIYPDAPNQAHTKIFIWAKCTSMSVVSDILVLSSCLETERVSLISAAKSNWIAPRFNIGNRRYIGGKTLLIEAIKNSIPDHINRGSFCDIFAGTGVVGDANLSEFETVIFNDLLFSNEIIYRGFFGKSSFSEVKLENFRQTMSIKTAKPIKHNYFSSYFSDKYFSEKSAKAIGYIRDEIENKDYGLNRREKDILLASLIYSADRIANTVGHYEAYRKGVKEFREFEFRLIDPYRNSNTKIFRQDANILAKKITADVVYIDPPYNSRQYSRFYHVLETLTKWDKPSLEGVALKPPVENISEYCKVGAADAFEDLISHLDTSLIMVSYNNTYASKSSSSRNKITLKEITSILKSKGRTRTKKIPHKHFSAGNTKFDNHLEYLFITEVS